MPYYLMEESRLQYLESARLVFDPRMYVAQHTAFIERTSSPSGERLLTVDGSTAHVSVIGVLSDTADFFFDMMMGGSAVYGDIIQAILAAEANDSVEKIVLEIQSPGGTVAGFFATAQAIFDVDKPIVAHVTGMAASAGYGLAAAADEIIISDPMAFVGSVGVMRSFFVDENRVVIVSSNAPDKHPDVTTPEGEATVKAELDTQAIEFVGIIAKGRKVSTETVNAEFGKGAIVFAKDALQAGMIDAINSESSNTTSTTEALSMDEAEFIAKYPALHKAVYDAAHATGVALEQERCKAHADAGTLAKSPEVALDFIADGTLMTSQSAAGAYLMAGLKAQGIAERIADNADTDPPAAGGPKGEGANTTASKAQRDTTQATNIIALMKHEGGVGSLDFDATGGLG